MAALTRMPDNPKTTGRSFRICTALRHPLRSCGTMFRCGLFPFCSGGRGALIALARSPQSRKPENRAMTITYSVVIPAYNEAAWLAKSLPCAGRCDGPQRCGRRNHRGGQQLLGSNGRGGAGARARVVFEPYNQISRARNSGARAATGRYLVFLDADTTMSAELLRLVIANLSGGGCCGGGALVRFDAVLPIYARWILRLWNWLAVRRRLAAGCFVFCLREGL